MSRIILIETSTSLCSVALAEDGKVVAYKESAEPRSQASLTAPFVKEVLDSKGLKASDCDAVCVSSGPGSYTGLRVGVSSAKGLCFGARLPLLAVDTMEILVNQAVEEGLLPEGCRTIIPMIDARRMEVYTSVWTSEDGVNFSRKTEIEPLIVAENSFKDELSAGPVLFIGDGALKCQSVLGDSNASYFGCCPKASAMAAPAERAYNEKRFENTAYFEPFYLKQFVATVSKKNLF